MQDREMAEEQRKELIVSWKGKGGEKKQKRLTKNVGQLGLVQGRHTNQANVGHLHHSASSPCHGSISSKHRLHFSTNQNTIFH